MLSNSKKIFVADDDTDILQIIRLMLQTQGYIVNISKNPKELFAYEELELPHLILLDIWMSGLDGREICNELKNNTLTKNIPVFFISANANIREIAQQYNADGYIAKPFEMSSLLNKIQDQLAILC